MQSLWWAEEAWNQLTLELVLSLRPQGVSRVSGAADDIFSRTFNAATYNIAGTKGITTSELLPKADFLADCFVLLGDHIKDASGMHAPYRPSGFVAEGVSSDARSLWRYNFQQNLNRNPLASQYKIGVAPQVGEKSFICRAEILSIVTPWTAEEFEDVMQEVLPHLNGMDDQESFYVLSNKDKIELISSRADKFAELWSVLAGFVKNHHLTDHSPSPSLQGEHNWQDFLIDFFLSPAHASSPLTRWRAGNLSAILANPDAKQENLLRAREVAGNEAVRFRRQMGGLSMALQLEKLVELFYHHPNLFKDPNLYERPIFDKGWEGEPKPKPFTKMDEDFLKTLFSEKGNTYTADADSYLPQLALVPENERLAKELTKEALRSNSASRISRFLPFVGVVLRELADDIGESGEQIPLEWALELL